MTIPQFIHKYCKINEHNQVYMNDCYLTFITESMGFTSDDSFIKFLIIHEIFHVESYRMCMGHDSDVACIGFSAREKKWYGWSHRAIYGFGIGYIAEEGDTCTKSGWAESYLREHPEEDLSVPVGFEVKTMDDAKRVAIAFAESIN